MTSQELNKILSDALSLPAETEIVEFKEAKEGYDFGKIGKYFSALSNEANLKGKSCAWLIFGVDNKHKIVGSNYRRQRKDLDSLKKEIGDKTTQNMSFIEIYELHKPEGRVIMFQIPAAPQGIPMAFEGYYHGRINESLVALNIEKIERIRNQVIGRDWSRNIVPEATFADLDKEAIRKAREQYKLKHPSLTSDVDSWDDVVFLNKAKVTLNGQITNTAILLLGKDEASPLISPAVAQISWILKDAPGGYAHFHTPFILTVDKVLACLRNLRYSYMVDDTTLFPKEVTRYDDWVMRETLHNAIAHSDYSSQCRIIVLEYNNRLLFENAGGFIPDSVEEVIHSDRPQPYYRNLFLVEAMVNLNMIDTIGSGIRKMFNIQRERFFPMPTYDISDKDHTEVTIHGELINENYSRILFKHPELSLEEVIVLDKVQKKIPVSERETAHLLELKLVIDVASNLFITESYQNATFNDYKKLILDFLKINGTATREDINNLIIPLFIEDDPIEKKQKKVSNILSKLAYADKKIENISKSVRYPVWKLSNVAEGSK
ncbi:MAG: putative DNA binding domain-containing protein [Tannerellaceae bacterium]|nr:putative DNA binding domain-containing protein [Tannerellaceae bacterium]